MACQCGTLRISDALGAADSATPPKKGLLVLSPKCVARRRSAWRYWPVGAFRRVGGAQLWPWAHPRLRSGGSVPPLSLIKSNAQIEQVERSPSGVAKSNPFAAIAHGHSLAEAIVDAIREPLLVLDLDLRVIAASRSFYRTFAVTPRKTEGWLDRPPSSGPVAMLV